jgi:hypothetical protein
MKQSIGGVYLYNFIIVYIVVVFAFICGFLSYNRAFKVNNRIINSIEKFEGYNEGSKNEINRTLKTLGYASGTPTCPDRKGGHIIYHEGSPYNYCLYKFISDVDQKKYYKYGITTYIYIDIPVVGKKLRLPVYSTSNRIFVFSDQMNKVKE